MSHIFSFQPSIEVFKVVNHHAIPNISKIIRLPGRTLFYLSRGRRLSNQDLPRNLVPTRRELVKYQSPLFPCQRTTPRNSFRDILALRFGDGLSGRCSGVYSSLESDSRMSDLETTGTGYADPLERSLYLGLKIFAEEMGVHEEHLEGFSCSNKYFLNLAGDYGPIRLGSSRSS